MDEERIFNHDHVVIIDLCLVISDFIPSTQPGKWWYGHFSKDNVYYVSYTYSFIITLELPLDFHVPPVELVLSNI